MMNVEIKKNKKELVELVNLLPAFQTVTDCAERLANNPLPSQEYEELVLECENEFKKYFDAMCSIMMMIEKNNNTLGGVQ